MEYNKLDLEEIKKKKSKIITMEESLTDIEPFLSEEEIEEIIKNKKPIELK